MPETKQHLLLETSIVAPGTKLFPNLAAHYATPEDFLMDQQSKFMLGVELNSENKLIVKGSKMIKLQAELTELKISSQTEIAELKLANERLMAQVKTLELGSNSKVIP